MYFVVKTAMSPTEVTEKLALVKLGRSEKDRDQNKERSWYCHPSNALEGDGLFEGAYHLPLVPYRAVASVPDLLTILSASRTGLSWLSQNIKTAEKRK